LACYNEAYLSSLLEMNETSDKGTGRSLSSPRYHRIVAKLGTSLLTGGSDRLDEAMMSSLVAQIAQLHNQGLEFLLVTSGAQGGIAPAGIGFSGTGTADAGLRPFVQST
jgi:hypothetical protein